MATALGIFGNAIRELRTQKGFSQEDLAERCGLHRTYIGGIERGERNIGLLNVLYLANALDVLPSELFRDFNKTVMSKLPKK